MDPRTRLIAIVGGALAATALAVVVLYGKNGDDVHERAVALEGIELTPSRPNVPEVAFYDADGAATSLSDFGGKFVVLNLWATWCAPCVAELPALARAQEQLAEDDILIIPVDMEKLDAQAVGAFLAKHGADTLPVYIDRDFSLLRGFDAFAIGLPFTVFIDEDGREVARVSGPQEWDDQAAIAYIRQLAAADS